MNLYSRIELKDGMIQEFLLLTVCVEEDILLKHSITFVIQSESLEEVIKIILISVFYKIKLESISIHMLQELWLFLNLFNLLYKDINNNK